MHPCSVSGMSYYIIRAHTPVCYPVSYYNMYTLACNEHSQSQSAWSEIWLPVKWQAMQAVDMVTSGIFIKKINFRYTWELFCIYGKSMHGESYSPRIHTLYNEKWEIPSLRPYHVLTPFYIGRIKRCHLSFSYHLLVFLVLTFFYF